MLGDRSCEQDKQLANQNKRLDALEEAQAKLGTSTAKEDIVIKSKLTDSDITSEADKQAEDKLAILMKQQEQILRDMALLKVQATASTPALQPTANPAASTRTDTKNDSRADVDNTSQRARKKAKKMEAAQAATAQMTASASPQPLPPSFTGRNDSGKSRTQQQHQRGTAGGQGSSQGFAKRQNSQQPTRNAQTQKNQGRQKGGNQARV